MAPGRPLSVLQATKMGAQTGNLAVVDRKGISAFWIELACACRVRALPLPCLSLVDLRSPPGLPGRHSFRPTSSRLPFRRLRRIGTLPLLRCARYTPHPDPPPQGDGVLWISCGPALLSSTFSPLR